MSWSGCDVSSCRDLHWWCSAGVGEKKYDETAVCMIAVLRYGNGFPELLETLEANLGILLPSGNQCDLRWRR